MLDGLAIKWCCRPEMVARDVKRDLYFQFTITKEGGYQEKEHTWPPPEQQQQRRRLHSSSSHSSSSSSSSSGRVQAQQPYWPLP
jgi:hypothetical protein